MSEFVSVECEDLSGCILASKYRDWFADHWSLAPPTKCPTECVAGGQPPAELQPDADLINRVWIVTQSEANRPMGAIALHSALRDAGLNPGYRIAHCLSPKEFIFVVGRASSD